MRLAIALIATVWQCTNAGGYYGGGGGSGGGEGNAQSFAHFQGPVVGPAQPVSAGYDQGSGHGQGHGQGQGYYGGGGGGGGGQGNAQSFAHFQGPVVGPAQPVQVGQSQGYGHGHGHGHGTGSGQGHGQGHGHGQGQSIDYVAYPKYNFAYGVTDYTTGDSHGQKESRDGDNVVGQYSLKEPGGNFRTVNYHADKDGFHVQVHNSNGNDHSGAHHGQKY